MTQVYSVPSREEEPHSLPDCEVFYVDDLDVEDDETVFYQREPGWYWWACFPGCLPDSDPIGPFASEREAIEDAQSEAWQFEDDETESESDV